MQKNISCAALPPLRPPGGRRYACYFMYKIILLQDNKSIQGAGVTAGTGGCKSEAACAPGAREIGKFITY